jgi:hypothetical protein
MNGLTWSFGTDGSLMEAVPHGFVVMSASPAAESSPLDAFQLRTVT